MAKRKNKRSHHPSRQKIPCKYCGTSAKLIECSTCNRKLYCSSECRLRDWNNHKNDCQQEMRKPSERTHKHQVSTVFLISKKEERCDSCGKSGIKLQKCSRCHEVKYCSKICQKAEWPNHKVDCEENGKIPKNSEERCDSCGKSGIKLQKCSRCHKVKYCCKKCQKADWPNHKVDCEENGKIPAGTSDDNSEEKCDSCGKSDVKLQKCSRCHEVMYCSKKCQKADWPNHKVDCEENGKIPADASDDNSAEKCDSCGKSGVKLQRCSRCHKVKYCSKKCQKAEWPNHKVDCEENGKIPAGASAENSEERCDTCGKSGIKLQKCSRCHKVKYCCKKCQKADWPNHKVDCKENGKIPAGTSDDNSEEECDGCGKSDGKLKRCSRCHKVKYCSEKCQKAKWPNHKVDCEENGFLERSRQIARDIYPDFEVITKCAHIQHSPLFPFIRFKQVLVVRMSRRGHHLFRPSMNLIDEDGNELFLIFYLDDPADIVIFPWHVLIPGNYICIPFPRICYYMDGTIGFHGETTDFTIIQNDCLLEC